jgi:hypothetical protein
MTNKCISASLYFYVISNQVARSEGGRLGKDVEDDEVRATVARLFSDKPFGSLRL